MKFIIVILSIVFSQLAVAQTSPIKLGKGSTASIECVDKIATPYTLSQSLNQIIIDCKRTCFFRIDTKTDYANRMYYSVMGKYAGDYDFGFHGNSSFSLDEAKQLAEREASEAAIAHASLCERVVRLNF